MGYHGTTTPAVVQQRILEDPAWYTPYTPYQAEISQGRLEMLLNFQTMVTDLVSMDVCNASLLDEATAAAEAMQMCVTTAKKRNKFFVSERVAPHTINLLQTRAEPIGVDIVVGSPDSVDFSANDLS